MEVFYHGTVRSFADEIVRTQRLGYSGGEQHFLGNGVYLYKEQLQARVWAEMKAKSRMSEPVVLRVGVCVPGLEYLDLDLRANQDEFFYWRQQYLKKLGLPGAQHPYYTDSHFCDFISEVLSVNMLAKTFVYVHKKEQQLPVLHTNQKQTNRNITRHFRTEKQYCLKEDSWIKDISEWQVSDYG
ncbi:hypothetical protein [Brevibacillus dissolubilis]|uniref:hypothetical protein n=1 Tax=Brevibacillus dissolubilis TaxID=1844116 RepID=UPI0011169864|nr:hypothetical protein [Brevibacillus dissolubilis]